MKKVAIFITALMFSISLSNNASAIECVSINDSNYLTKGVCDASLENDTSFEDYCDSYLTNNDVALLQRYLGVNPSGYYGSRTVARVKTFQINNNISPVNGNVGPLTRDKLEALTCSQNSLGGTAKQGMTSDGMYGASTVTLTVRKEGNGQGTISSSPSSAINCGATTCSVTYTLPIYSPLLLTPTPAPGSYFAGWQDIGLGGVSVPSCTPSALVDCNPNRISVDLSQGSRTIRAVFNSGSAPAPNNLSVIKVGSGIVRSSTGVIDCGSRCSASISGQVTLTAEPSQGLSFTGWSGGGCSGTDACTVTMDTAKTVQASFSTTQTTNTKTLTVTKSGSGGMYGLVTSSPAGINCGTSCSANMSLNSQVTLTVDTTSNVPSAYSLAFTGWSGACSGTGRSCTVTMSEAKDVTASFVVAMATTPTVTTRGGPFIAWESPIGSGTTTNAINVDPMQMRRWHWGAPVSSGAVSNVEALYRVDDAFLGSGCTSKTDVFVSGWEPWSVTGQNSAGRNIVSGNRFYGSNENIAGESRYGCKITARFKVTYTTGTVVTAPDAIVSFIPRSQQNIKITAPVGGETWYKNLSIDSDTCSVLKCENIAWTQNGVVIHDYRNFTAYLEKKSNNDFIVVGKIPPYGVGSIGWPVGIIVGLSCPLENHFSCTKTIVPDGQYYVRLVDNQTGASDRGGPVNIVTRGGASNSVSAVSAELVGTQRSYRSGDTILFSMRGIDSTGAVATPDRGLHVQANMYQDSTMTYEPVYVNGVPQSVNGVYNYNTRMWDVTFTAPSDTSRTYYVRAVFYCSNSSAGCVSSTAPGNVNGEIVKTFSFTVNTTAPAIRFIKSADPSHQNDLQSDGSTYSGGYFQLYWNSLNAASCTLDKKAPGSSTWTEVCSRGTMSATPNVSGSCTPNPGLVGTHQFRFSCTGTNGQATQPIVIDHVVKSYESYPTVKITYPNGGETLLMNSSRENDFTVYWNTSESLSGTAYIGLSSRSGGSCLLGTTLVERGSFPVRFGATYACQDGRRITPGNDYVITLKVDGTQGDQSDAPFTLTAPIQALPTISFTKSADPARPNDLQSDGSTYSGGYFQLYWNSLNAASCTLDKTAPGSSTWTEVCSRGTMSATPNASGSCTPNPGLVGTHQFRFSCTGTNGQATQPIIISHVVKDASQTTQQRILSLGMLGSGSGRVYLSPQGTLTGSNNWAYTNGTIVTITQSPHDGSTFAGWSSQSSPSGWPCAELGSSPTCTVTMNADKSVTATFNSIPQTPSAPTTSFTKSADPARPNDLQSDGSTYSGGAFKLDWNSSNAASCTLDKTAPGSSTWTEVCSRGTMSATPNVSGSCTPNPGLVGTHQFRFSCTGTNGQATQPIVINHTVKAVAPTGPQAVTPATPVGADTSCVVNGTSYNVYATNIPSNSVRVYFPTWSGGNQDDIQWPYVDKPASGWSSRVSQGISQSSYSRGTINTHVYSWDGTYKTDGSMNLSFIGGTAVNMCGTALTPPFSFQVIASSIRALEKNYALATGGAVALSAPTTLTPANTTEIINFTGLKRGANEMRVSKLKEILRTISPDVSRGCMNLSTTNTLYGPTTESCVKVFQNLNELEPTGIVNEATNRALNAVIAR